MFRRKSNSAAVADPTPFKAGGKNTPTPSRKEAEAARKVALKGKTDRKSLLKQERATQVNQRAKQRDAMASGDERFLPARDKGPAKRFVRDMIDSRRSAAEFFLPVALLVLVGSLTGVQAVIVVLTYVWLLCMVVMIVDSFLVTRRIKKQVSEKFPDEPTRGLGSYGLLRSLQIRRLRLPKPQVRVGGAPVVPKAARAGR